MSIGSNIKKRRIAMRISQQELASIMGYKTRSTIAKIESGENGVSESKLRKFAAVLNTTAEDLIAEHSPMSSSPNVLFADSNHKYCAIILAGGNAGNNRQNTPSQFLNVHGKPIIIYCMEVYQSHPAVDDIVVICLKGWESILSAYAKQYGITKLKTIIPGGNSGIVSLKKGIDFIDSYYNDDDFIIIQESTRPIISVETVSKLLSACIETGSATICYPMNEYVQFSVSHNGVTYINRDSTIALQSPEAHRLTLIKDVFRQADPKKLMQETCFTMLMYHLGHNINFIQNDVNNIKIIHEEDLAMFSMLTHLDSFSII